MIDYLKILRPPQWIKNSFVFAALLFGNMLGDPDAVLLSIEAFIVFCMASSIGYIINDIIDRERDSLHPLKKSRPIPSGRVSAPAALGVAALLGMLIMSFALFSALPGRFWWTVGMYFILTLAYSLALKHRMILDVIVIAILFVLRALAGAAAIEVVASPWLFICTFMLCMFLGFGKRRCEIAAIGQSGDIGGHRPTLIRYTPNLLTHLLSTSGGIAIITFLLYTLDTNWHSPFEAQKQYLIYTLPLVVYGIFRYAMLIELGDASGPTELILKDPAFLAALVLWVGMTLMILYGRPAEWGFLPMMNQSANHLPSAGTAVMAS